MPASIPPSTVSVMSMTRAEAEAVISVVAPVYNELETLSEFHRRVTAALTDLRYELVLVDDGSTDGSSELLEELADRDARVRPVHLSRNFGHQAAVTAGLEAACGAAVITIDADLQDPPEVIRRLVEQWQAGADVVHAVRHERPGESRRRLFRTSRLPWELGRFPSDLACGARRAERSP